MPHGTSVGLGIEDPVVTFLGIIGANELVPMNWAIILS